MVGDRGKGEAARSWGRGGGVDGGRGDGSETVDAKD